MDFLNKAKDALNQAQNSGENTNPPPANPENTNANANANTENPAPAPAAGGSNDSEDYGDKALDFAEKKFGFSQSRETNEKITDTARGLFEQATGKKVDSKYSN